VIAPSFAVGAYSRGHGKDLGCPPIPGRSGIDLQYTVSDDVRVGVAIHHMSNGNVLGQDHNPGTELIGTTLAIAMS
jgi:lipid A 3-O-deacylase